MLANTLNKVRSISPLVHSITNIVTVNDCANILLATGASPIMADDEGEVEDIVSLAHALVINIGTLNTRTIKSMLIAGRRANELNCPIILDPVGCGASTLRKTTVQAILENIRPTVIRGNLSEIKALHLGTKNTRGVDADTTDIISADNIAEIAELARATAKATQAVIVISGAVDVVATATNAYLCHNGDKLMSRITGAGCMGTALIGAYVGALTHKSMTGDIAEVAKINAAIGTDEDCPLFNNVLAAVCAMGIAGEVAKKRLSADDGNAGYRNYLIDAVYNMTEEQLIAEARYEKS